ncbi:MAG: alpha/beta hydrolase [Rhodobacteraceae bacterium]|nr:alpha/beta hydrolase [Paracoccaceae bacterium]
MARVIFGLVGVLVIGAAIYAGLLEIGAFDISRADLEAKYTTPDSKFAEVDGVRIHYMDQGPRDAEALVLVHASYMSLRSFDAIAPLLAKNFRVVRFDLPNAGLSGPDPQNRYSIELNMEVLDQLTRDLGIDKFALFGTSSGGPVAFRYAAEHPDRVTRLILINSAGMPRTAATNPNRQRVSDLQLWINRRHESMAYWTEGLSTNFTSMAPPHDLIEMVYDMNRIEGHRDVAAAFMRNFKTGDPQEMLGRVTMPTLIGWGIKNPTVMHLEADVMSLWLTSAPSKVIKYPDVAHYLYIEIPDKVAADMTAFLKGEMDGELRVTKRVPMADIAAVDALESSESAPQ